MQVGYASGQGLSIGLGVLSTLPLGTMFTPASLISRVNVGGLMEASGDGTGLTARLPSNNFSVHYRGSIFGPAAGGREQLQAWFEDSASVIDLITPSPGAIWALEEVLWSSLRSVGIIPIVLLAWMAVQARKSRTSETEKSLSTLAAVGLLSLAIGALAVTSLRYNGFESELARFLLFPSLVGSFIGAFVVGAGSASPKRWTRFAVGSLILVGLVGPATNFVATSVDSIGQIWNDTGVLLGQTAFQGQPIPLEPGEEPELCGLAD